jgi:hypothetical protein
MLDANETSSSAGPQPEKRPAGQGHHRRARQGQRGHRDVEVHAGGQPGMGLAIGIKRHLLGLQRIEAEVTPQIQSNIKRHKHGNGDNDKQFTQ